MNDYKIYEGYSRSLTRVDEGVVIAFIAGAVIANTLLKVLKKIRTNKPKLIDYVTALIRFMSEDATSDGININDIRRYAYEHMRDAAEFTESKDADKDSIFSKDSILKGKKLKGQAKSKFIGRLIAYAINKFNLKKSDVDKILKPFESK